MGFPGFMRAEEITVTHQGEFDLSASLCLRDIANDNHQNPSMVQVVLRQRKTNLFRKGECIYLGRTNVDLCHISICYNSPSG